MEGKQLEWCGSREKEMKKNLPFKILNQNIRGIVGSAVCHVVSYWMFSFEARVCFPGRLHGTCDGQIGATTGFLSSEYYHFFLSATIPPAVNTHSLFGPWTVGPVALEVVSPHFKKSKKS
jgi:hypothetical protein